MLSARRTLAASPGTNLGCVVMIVLPDADCGSSSVMRSRSYSSDTLPSTSFSINAVMNVDLPARTGPTTPIYISPPVRSLISL